MPSVNGLQDVIAAETSLCHIDGERGLLVYRGYAAGSLATERCFEEVAHLLWTGRLPNESELSRLRQDLGAARVLPDWVASVIDALPPHLGMMTTLQTAIAAAGAVPSAAGGAVKDAAASAAPSAAGGATKGAAEAAGDWPPTMQQAVRLTGLVPAIVARRWARLEGRTAPDADRGSAHVDDCLRMLTGRQPSAAHVSALGAYLVLTMDHGLNASTFAARVVSSTESDIAAAIAAAIGAMKGPLHGGAPSQVMDMLEEIGQPEHVEPWLRGRLDAGERLMGFGHRVYRTVDPRAVALRDRVRQLEGDDHWLDLAALTEATAVQLLAEYKPGRRLFTNVEFWAAAILRAVQLPKPLYTATFTSSRVVGWSAHVLEQSGCNRLIRPKSVYDGPLPPED